MDAKTGDAVIIRPTLPPNATMTEKISEMTERMRITAITMSAPLEVHLGTDYEQFAPRHALGLLAAAPSARLTHEHA